MEVKAIQFFNKSKLLTKLYILLYLAVMFSGSTFVKSYVSAFVLIAVFLLFCMTYVKQVQRNAVLSRDNTLFLLVIVILIFLGFQLSVAYVPSIVLAYIRRFSFFSLLLLFVPKLDLAASLIKLSKYYSFLVACSIIIFTVVKGEKSGGLVGNYQYGGMLMSIACILFLIDYFNNHKEKFNLIGFLFCLCGLLICGKRMFAILVMLSFFVIYIISKDRKKTNRLIFALIVIFIGLLVMYYFAPSTRMLYDRFVNLYGDNQTFTSGRNVLWEKAFEVFKSNKTYGIGFGAFRTYFENNFSISGISAYLAHNIYVGLLAETGIIGFTLFVSLMLISLIKTLNLLKTIRKTDNFKIKYIYTYSLLLQLWFIVYGFTGNGIYDADETFFYFSAIAMMLSIKTYLYKNKTEPSFEVKQNKLENRVY